MSVLNRVSIIILLVETLLSIQPLALMLLSPALMVMVQVMIFITQQHPLLNLATQLRYQYRCLSPVGDIFQQYKIIPIIRCILSILIYKYNYLSTST